MNIERCPVCRRLVVKDHHGQSECERLATSKSTRAEAVENEYTNPTGDVPHVQCSICGWWVPRNKHTWTECASLVRLSGKLHIFIDDKARQPIPSGFYTAFNWEAPDE